MKMAVTEDYYLFYSTAHCNIEVTEGRDAGRSFERHNHIFVKWFVTTATCYLIVAVLWPGSLALSWSVGYYHEHT
jgi:hypothetical protein